MKVSTELLTIESGKTADAKLATAGYYPPQLTVAQLPAFAGVEGMLVYNVDTNKLNICVSGAWEAVTSST